MLRSGCVHASALKMSLPKLKKTELMGYPKFIVLRVRLLLLAAALGLIGTGQRQDTERVAKETTKKGAEVSSAPAQNEVIEKQDVARSASHSH